MLAACQRSDAPPPFVCVVRHAEAYKNLPDPPADPALADQLTPTGRAQAAATGAALPRPLARVAASPAGRARQTAEDLATGLMVEVWPDLQPLRGDLPWSAREEAWRRGEDPRPEGGESLADGRLRAAKVLDQVRARGGSTVLVTHGDLGPLLLGELAGTPLADRSATHALANGEARCLPLAGG